MPNPSPAFCKVKQPRRLCGRMAKSLSVQSISRFWQNEPNWSDFPKMHNDLAILPAITAAAVTLQKAGEGLGMMVRLQAAFEQGRIQFLDAEETGGFGVRMAKRKRKR
jgi:hypothetical protein